ncbi:TPA: hypothetical protein N0F65_009623 [Lagenidium giganteum]|uniref:Uncharacterized protein n=1 Tax=Lagenidium giganteum TaxID=4803 RepID=A0AAV2YYX6_9STRA|nr:TPA: hypothetical protein N0F65_009623 [Lagenidium giganteum]
MQLSSKFCMVVGCTTRAKTARRCWKHGGSTECQVDGCCNRGKSKGVYWSQGGGAQCSVEPVTQSPSLTEFAGHMEVASGVGFVDARDQRSSLHKISAPLTSKSI